MTKKELAKYDQMIIALRCAEREFMDMIEYQRIEGEGAVLRPQEIASIKKALDTVRMAQ